MSIRREITVTRKGLPCPIDITYGTNMLPIEFVVTDFNIPEGATAKAFAMEGNKKVKSQSAIISRNVISFTPEIGLFEEGKNVLQLAVTHSGKNLFTFYQPVNGHYTMQFEGAQDLENDPTFAGMVMQMQQEIAEISETIDELSKGEINISNYGLTAKDLGGGVVEILLTAIATSGVTQSGNTLIIIDGVTATHNESTLAIA